MHAGVALIGRLKPETAAEGQGHNNNLSACTPLPNLLMSLLLPLHVEAQAFQQSYFNRRAVGDGHSVSTEAVRQLARALQRLQRLVTWAVKVEEQNWGWWCEKPEVTVRWKAAAALTPHFARAAWQATRERAAALLGGTALELSRVACPCCMALHAFAAWPPMQLLHALARPGCMPMLHALVRTCYMHLHALASCPCCMHQKMRAKRGACMTHRSMQARTQGALHPSTWHGMLLGGLFHMLLFTRKLLGS